MANETTHTNTKQAYLHTKSEPTPAAPAFASANDTRNKTTARRMAIGRVFNTPVAELLSCTSAAKLRRNGQLKLSVPGSFGSYLKKCSSNETLVQQRVCVYASYSSSALTFPLSGEKHHHLVFYPGMKAQARSKKTIAGRW